jgi:hypothetical protein
VSALSSATVSQPVIRSDGDVLVELKDVNVSYHERKVSISDLLLPLARHKFLRCSKIQTGWYEQVKGGTFKDQTVCYDGFACVVVWMANRTV